MKKTDKQLRRLIQSHPAEISPAKKEALLTVLAQKRIQEETDMMHYRINRNLRRILVIAALAVSLTVMISAAAVIRYYRTPGGNIADNSGNPPPDDVSIASGGNEQIISGDGYRIPRVTWSTVDGHTTLGVWSAPGYAALSGLRAVTDAGEEYP